MKKETGLKPGQIPTREELFLAIENQEAAFLTNQLNNLLNQPPHKDWIKTNNGLEYLPIEKVEFMLFYIFGSWEWHIKREGVIANSVFVTGTLRVWNAWLNVWQEQDGIGAVPIQLDKSNPPGDVVRPSDLSRLKSQSIQMNLPAASSYAMSNAAARFGKIFGRDLNRKDTISGFMFDVEEPKTPPPPATTHIPGSVQTEQLITSNGKANEILQQPIQLTPQKITIQL